MVFSLSSCAFVLCVVAAFGANHDRNGMLRHSSVGKDKTEGGVEATAGGFVRTLQFKHRLRVCNAYPYNGALDIFGGRMKITGESPMPYKTCRDFLSPLKAGDKLDFKVGDANAGTFSVSDLPNNDAVLLLVIHRHDTLSTAVSFESHVFANLMNAQVAVIDCYKGHTTGTMRISDDSSYKKGKGKEGQKAVTPRSEELRYDSVVAVNEGVYQVQLTGAEGKTLLTQPLVALNRESYVVLRAGVESQQGPKYQQELIVYPQSDPTQFHSGAKGMCASGLLLAFLAMAASAMF